MAVADAVAHKYRKDNGLQLRATAAMRASNP
jgi:hypothetical protein